MKKQTFFGRWMQNSYLLFVFALVISLVVWVYMSFNSPNITTSFLHIITHFFIFHQRKNDKIIF